MARRIDQLRAEVARAERLVGDKAARVERSSGARVAGSQYDPRRGGQVSGYNSKQLSNYLRELNSFRDRKVQFVSGSQGAPIPKHVAARYESVRASYNRMARQEFDSVASVTLPGGGTVLQREMEMAPMQRRARGRASNRPRGSYDIDASKVVSADAMMKLEANLRKRMSDSHVKLSMLQQRRHATELMHSIGEGDLADDMAKLSDKQFNVLWNYTDFAETTSGRYEAMKNLSVQQETQTSDEFRAEVQNVLAWAKNIR